ncbi:lycopene cyclase (CrtL-type) [Tamaricihabitans halophyticus]|uniref:Lycopene cyclase (CrtL-type) n=1 Tax=Tamaricihabitans halophyticus TaxID=1262583 RepID=A0A4R2R2E3_9PSEU|nr:lycopene cyclase family protein [Tamaricihabitans halophyticus]TCP53661.1 lycopene cyclase (CrtL-type) [Tamaricihabitans halophyticus]
MFDVVVAGAGPTGWALASHCARYGLRVAVLDPAPERRWPATYGGWADELEFLPGSTIAARPSQTRVITRANQRVDRDYLILRNAGLARWLREDTVERISASASGVRTGPHGVTIELAGGRQLASAVAVDATGYARALSGGPVRGARTEQTAFGLVFPEAVVAELVEPGSAVLMDWRPAPNATGGTASFCYGVPVGTGQVLVEETSLAKRPALPYQPLRERLAARLATAGVRTAQALRTERVRIPLDLPLPRGPVLGFGVAAGLVHPATGYGLASALQLAEPVAAAIAGGLPNPAAANSAAGAVLWPNRARSVHALRRYGLRALRRMSGAELAVFFEVFFGMDQPTQRAYLSGRDDLLGTLAAMRAIYADSPSALRRRLSGGMLPMISRAAG